jgi:hypothetical protein
VLEEPWVVGTNEESHQKPNCKKIGSVQSALLTYLLTTKSYALPTSQ